MWGGELADKRLDDRRLRLTDSSGAHNMEKGEEEHSKDICRFPELSTLHSLIFMSIAGISFFLFVFLSLVLMEEEL